MGRGPSRNRREPLHMHDAGRHPFGEAWTSVAADKHRGVLVHARRVVTGVPVDFDFHRRIHTGGDVVRAIRIEHAHLFRRAQSTVQELVELAQRLLRQIEGDDFRRCRCLR